MYFLPLLAVSTTSKSAQQAGPYPPPFPPQPSSPHPPPFPPPFPPPECIEDWASCQVGGPACCSQDRKCFAQNPWYAQCLVHCPKGWNCIPDDPAVAPRPPPFPPPSPTGCIPTWGRCHMGGNACCDKEISCFKQHQWYSQCRSSCPRSWDCSTSSATPSPLPPPSPPPVPPFNVSLVINPLDSIVGELALLAEQEARTTFSGVRVFNGLPDFIYATRYILASEAAPISATEEEIASELTRSIVTSFLRIGVASDLNSSEASEIQLVRKIESQGGVFCFQWLRGGLPLDLNSGLLPDAFYLEVSSQDSSFTINTPNVSLMDLSFDFNLPMPPLPAQGLILPSNSSGFDNLTARSLLAIFLDGEGKALADGEVTFVATSPDASLLTRVRPALNLGGGTFATGYPFLTITDASEEWQQLMQEHTEAHIQHTCDVLVRHRLVLFVYSQMCRQIQQQLESSTVYEEGNAAIRMEATQVVDACYAFLASWAASCPFTTPPDEGRTEAGSLVSTALTVNLVDTYRATLQRLTPRARLYSEGPPIVQAGSLISLPPGRGGITQYVGPPTNTISTPFERSVCNGLTNAGANQPDTKRVRLGVSSGSFYFQYQTFTVPDEILIRHGGNLIFTTGCVGATQRVLVTLSSAQTDIIEVEVIPNCAGTSSTFWEYVLSCPNDEPTFECTPNGACFCRQSDGQTTGLLDKGLTPGTNGCGPAGSPLGTLLLKVLLFAFGLPWAGRFQSTCDVHDRCYATCSASRSDCDDQMCAGFNDACDDLPFLLFFLQPRCRGQALAMCEAVRWGGQSAFEAAQKANCEC